MNKSQRLIGIVEETVDINLEPIAQELKTAVQSIFPKSTVIVSQPKLGDDYFF